MYSNTSERDKAKIGGGNYLYSLLCQLGNSRENSKYKVSKNRSKYKPLGRAYCVKMECRGGCNFVNHQ